MARDAVTAVGSVLAALGHTVVERTPDYKNVGNDIPILYTRGIRGHYETVPHTEHFESRTRGVARYGRIIPDRLLRSALRRQAVHAERINEIFADVDILLTPVTGTMPATSRHPVVRRNGSTLDAAGLRLSQIARNRSVT